MTDTIRDRLKLFARHLGMSEAKLERAANLSNGYVSTVNNNITVKSLDKILAAFPNLNRNWLLTGTGNMLLDIGTDPDTEPASMVAEEGSSYLAQRRRLKNGPAPPEADGIIYVPIAAQAGYQRSYADPLYTSQLQRVSLPGLPYRGAEYRLFEVNGDSMEPTLKEGYQVVAQLLEPDHWHNLANYYIYVVVTSSQILIKRIYRMDDERLVLISDNEEYYPQQLLPMAEVKELWLVKRKLDWEMAPPKKFDITIQ